MCVGWWRPPRYDRGRVGKGGGGKAGGRTGRGGWGAEETLKGLG